MKSLKATLLVLLSLSALSAVGTPAPDPSLDLQGVLQVGEFFGSPDYGEHPDSDRLERSYFLQLPAPIATQLQGKRSSLAQVDEASRRAYFVQLVVPEDEQSHARLLLGKRVRATGKLFGAVSGHHRTPVLMEVQKLSELEGWRW